uniref:CXXC-type zinc finger protein 1 n=1 Tax=Anopheles atroparvus TaxID=41427 RepID=A0A182IJE4_ANOAO
MTEPKKRSKKSKEEIAKEFDLPERKSKIATILKQDGQAYCLCRSSDSSRFMICCDACEEWYHGDCINVSEKEAKHIKHYYCQRCKEEDPSLQTVFRLVPAPCPTPNPEEKKPPKKKKDKPPGGSSSEKRCGQCEGCQTENCGSCDGCLGQTRNGRKQRCELRICSNSASRKKDRAALKAAARNKKRKRSLTPELIINPALEGDQRAKRCTLDPNALENSDVEDEMSMYCITCGHEIHSKTAIRHMEKCFNKYESQASFGSIFKTRIDGNSMFCDFYNPASKTYCKRLRVLCPEHCKDPKVSDTDVCGCPLVRNVFQLTGEFCRAPKKSCFKHYVWEKIRRAEIDLERVRQWLKMDELMEQERQIRQAMASRAGVLGLMLHSTYNHEIMEKLCTGKY